MATSAIANHTGDMSLSTMEDVLVGGDLSRLNNQDRLLYYRKVCESVGLNPLTKPFDYLRLSGRLVLYARKDATDQLRRIHNVSIEISDRERIDDVYVVTALARMPDGRTDSEIGAVTVSGLKGEALANAMMKATTKAKRRVTLSICGMGMLDETEAESIPQQQREFVEVNHDTGEIIEPVRPVQQQRPVSREQAGSEPAITDSQVSFVEKLARDLGFDDDALESLVNDRYGRTLHGLSKREASSLIEHFQAVQKGVPQRTDDDVNPGGITEPQTKAVHAIARKLDMDHDALNDYAANRFGGHTVKELTKGEASELIDELQQMQREQG